MAERRVADVVDECERFGEIDVQLQLFGDGARNLCDFDGVRQPVAEVMAYALGENLGFIFEAAEGAGVNDAVAIALKVIAIGMWWFGIASAAGAFDSHGVIGEHRASVANLVFADKTDMGESLGLLLRSLPRTEVAKQLLRSARINF